MTINVESIFVLRDEKEREKRREEERREEERREEREDKLIRLGIFHCNTFES